MEITWEKLIAAGLAGCFFVACWIVGGSWGAFLLTLYGLLLPLAMIWFEEIIGGLTGFVRGGYIGKT